jgi:high-affinity nickel-transport protein
MLGAYGWAFVKPVRKLYYNLTITSVSVAVAFAVGGIEALGLLADRFGPSGFFWQIVRRLNENFGLLGYCIVALFAASWIFSLAVYNGGADRGRRSFGGELSCRRHQGSCASASRFEAC